VHALPGSLLAPRPGSGGAAGSAHGGATVLLFTRGVARDDERAVPAGTRRSTADVDVSAVPALPTSSSGRTCSCGHEKQAHEHYRRGTDCAVCSCARYDRPLLRRLVPRRR
jgi:hypothetical protein